MSTCEITHLPSDLVFLVCTFIDFKSFLKFEATCKEYHKMLLYDGRNNPRLMLDFQMIFFASKKEPVLINIARKTYIGDTFFLVPANLKHFVKSNFLDLFKLFLENTIDDPNLDYVFNHVVVHTNQPKATGFLKALLDRGISNPNLSYYMIESIVNMNFSCTELFLRYGANPNNPHNGILGLFSAAETGLDYCKLLMKYEADVNIRGDLGENVLSVSLDQMIFEYFVEKGANVHNVMIDGQSLLHIAAQNLMTKRYLRLLDLGVNSSLQDFSRRTAREVLLSKIPLMETKFMNDRELILSLIGSNISNDIS